MFLKHKKGREMKEENHHDHKVIGAEPVQTKEKGDA